MTENEIAQQPPIIQTVPNKPFPWLVVLLMLIIVGLVSGGGVYLWQQNEIKNLQAGQMPPVVTIPTREVLPPQSTAEPTLVPTKFIATPRLSSVDSAWNLYTNAQLGFSIKVPKVVVGQSHNNCPENFTSPTTIFDDATGAFITVDYFYEYPVNNVCTKTTNSLVIVDQRANQWKNGQGNTLFVPSNWHIIVAKVNNDQELDQFIKKSWGNACMLGSKTKLANGIYDVHVKGDGLDMEVSKCFLNFAMAFKYSPELNKAATWGIGQDITFNSLNSKSYDLDMVDSFVFTK